MRRPFAAWLALMVLGCATSRPHEDEPPALEGGPVAPRFSLRFAPEPDAEMVQAPRCWLYTCRSGCCQGDVCQAGTSARACGSMGNQCSDCRLHDAGTCSTVRSCQ